MTTEDHRFWEPVNALLKRLGSFDADGFNERITQLTPFECHLLCAFCVDSELCNCGFYGCFGNPTGICAPLAVEGFRAFGRDDLAGIVAEAIERLGSPFPRDEDERWEIIEALPDSENHFDDLDSRYYDLRYRPDIYDTFDEHLARQRH